MQPVPDPNPRSSEQDSHEQPPIIEAPIVTDLGRPETIGQLKALIASYPDEMSFGFRGGPLMNLREVAYPKEKFVVFDAGYIVEHGPLEISTDITPEEWEEIVRKWRETPNEITTFDLDFREERKGIPSRIISYEDLVRVAQEKFPEHPVTKGVEEVLRIWFEGSQQIYGNEIYREISSLEIPDKLSPEEFKKLYEGDWRPDRDDKTWLDQHEEKMKADISPDEVFRITMPGEITGESMAKFFGHELIDLNAMRDGFKKDESGPTE